MKLNRSIGRVVYVLLALAFAGAVFEIALLWKVGVIGLLFYSILKR